MPSRGESTSLCLIRAEAATGAGIVFRVIDKHLVGKHEQRTWGKFRQRSNVTTGGRGDRQRHTCVYVLSGGMREGGGGRQWQMGAKRATIIP